MNKQRAEELSRKLEMTLIEFAQENNLKFKFKGSSYSDSSISQWKPKFEFTDISEISEDATLEEELFQNAVRKTYGRVKPEWFNKKITIGNGQIGHIREYNSRKSKYPLIVVTDDGKKWCCQINIIASQLEGQYENNN